MEAMQISESQENGVSVISPLGRLDPAGGPILEKCCLDRVKAGGNQMLLDFSGIEFVSSAGLRGILVIAKAVESSGGKLVLCGLRPMVAKVFEHSGFSIFLKIQADRAGGLGAFSAA